MNTKRTPYRSKDSYITGLLHTAGPIFTDVCSMSVSPICKLNRYFFGKSIPLRSSNFKFINTLQLIIVIIIWMIITFDTAKLSLYLDAKVGKYKADENTDYVLGPITAQLLTEGIITPALLKRLHEEWANKKLNDRRRIKELKSQKRKK